MKVCYPSEYETEQQREEGGEAGGSGAAAEPGAVGWITLDVSEGRLHN